MKTAATTTALPAPLFARQQGDGEPTLVCLHSSTGSHGQWRGLVAQLAGHATVLTPDFHGHGRSPAWPASGDATLQIDAQAVTRLMPEDGGAHLVAHSYGAAIALQIALSRPDRVRSLTLYEPVAFGVLHAMAPDSDALAEIAAIASRVARLSSEGRPAAAAEAFVCYWGGPNAWAGMSEAQRDSVASRIGTIPLHFEALFGAQWGPAHLRALRMPVLLMNGSHTRQSARHVVELLGSALPRVKRLEVEGAAHLGPMTHEAVVNEAIVGHLQACGAFQSVRARAAEPALS
jgi:pimeloyl-ACP methyl ester carboxylesterase